MNVEWLWIGNPIICILRRSEEHCVGRKDEESKATEIKIANKSYHKSVVASYTVDF